MASSNFSKKMCQELLLYEDYILSCKPMRFNKDNIVVERQTLMDLIVRLRSYHCADRSSTDDEPQTMMNLGEILSAKEDLALTEFQEITQKNTESERISPDEAAIAAKQIIEDAQTQAQLALEDAHTQAQFILEDAKRLAERIVTQAEEKAKEKQRQIDEVLVEKINEAERQAKAIVNKAVDNATLELETKEAQAMNLELAAFTKADNLIEQVEKIYARQLEVVMKDRQEIIKILNSLSKK